MSIFGYFSKPGSVPDYDPGLGINCPFCNQPLSEQPIKTISLKVPGDNRSYFYRAHKDCYEAIPPNAVNPVESELVDTIYAVRNN